VAPDTAYDTKTRLTWQRGGGGPLSWPAAKAYCSALAVAGGGFRLPTVKELATLLDEDRSNPPYQDRVVFPDVIAQLQIWTSTEAPATPPASNHWVVTFQEARWAVSDDAASYTVRCVK
jgi:hypothetical protein